MSTNLIRKAIEMKQFAVAPYSRFRVGAVLVTGDQRQFTGCNIESSTYGLTICAERVALFKAVSEGIDKFTEIYIAADSDKACPPCGACRQLLWEFAGNIKVIMIDHEGNYESEMLQDLLPHAFDGHYLEGR